MAGGGLNTLNCLILTDAQQSLRHQKGVYAYQWLVNVNMHVYAYVILIYHVVQEFIFINGTDSQRDYRAHLWVVKKVKKKYHDETKKYGIKLTYIQGQ